MKNMMALVNIITRNFGRVFLICLLASPLVTAAEERTDGFVEGYITTILERELAWSRGSYQLAVHESVRTSIDVLNAQQQLYGTRRDLAKARYATIMSLLRLRAATGQLDQLALAEVNQWLK